MGMQTYQWPGCDHNEEVITAWGTWWGHIEDRGTTTPTTGMWPQWGTTTRKTQGRHVKDGGVTIPMTRMWPQQGDDSTGDTARTHQGWGCNHAYNQDVTATRRGHDHDEDMLRTRVQLHQWPGHDWNEEVTIEWGTQWEHIKDGGTTMLITGIQPQQGGHEEDTSRIGAWPCPWPGYDHSKVMTAQRTQWGCIKDRGTTTPTIRMQWWQGDDNKRQWWTTQQGQG